MNKPAVDRARLAAMCPISLAGDEAGVFSDEKNSAPKTSSASRRRRCINCLAENAAKQRISIRESGAWITRS
jgi:hypothetical protein